MRRLSFVFFLLVSILLGACGGPPKLAAIPPGKTVLAFGNSVTFGTGAPHGENWPTHLAARTGWQIENSGIPGDTAEAGRDRIQKALDESKPALVIIELGGNDFLRRRPQSAVKEDLRRIVQAVRQTGAQAVLIAVPELSLLGAISKQQDDAPIYRELAKEERIPVISDVFSEILSRPELCADRIHPNASGNRQMAAGIHAQLSRIGLAGAKEQ
jgi:acyl-CoA thioesterase-1